MEATGSEEVNSISYQFEELALKNYEKFISTAEHSRNIFKQFEFTESKLEKVINDSSKFETICKKFSTETAELHTHHKLSSLSDKKNAELMSILEIPELMQSCIEQGDYENALEVAEYVTALRKKHPDIGVFKILQEQTDKLWSVILYKLISQLRTDIQLTNLQGISLLRRMKVFSETELRLKFLQARGSWLASLINDIQIRNDGQRVSKIVDVYRINLFNIITQYKAIFKDISTDSDFDIIGDLDIIQSWLHDQISAFLVMLEMDSMTPDVTSNFSSIFKQCMFFGLSLSKGGCDFRAQIGTIMTKSQLAIFERHIKEATNKLKKNMDCFTLINKIYTNPSAKSPEQTDQKYLQNFYPLAEYCNGILTALNHLKVCAPLSLVCNITDIIENSLLETSKIILVFYQQEHQAFTISGKDQFHIFCECFALELLPYIQTCIHQIYPLPCIAEHLGTTIKSLDDNNVSMLNTNLILEPIKHLLRF